MKTFNTKFSLIIFIPLCSFVTSCSTTNLNNRTLVYAATYNSSGGIERQNNRDYFIELINDTVYVTGYPDSSQFYLLEDTIYADSSRTKVLKIESDTSYEYVNYEKHYPFMLRKREDGIYFSYDDLTNKAIKESKWYSFIPGDTLLNCSPLSISSDGTFTCGGKSFYTGRDTIINMLGMKFYSYIFKELSGTHCIDCKCTLATKYIDKQTLLPIVIKYYYYDQFCKSYAGTWTEISLQKILPLAKKEEAVWRISK